jgi:hypothetical protein
MGMGMEMGDMIYDHSYSYKHSISKCLREAKTPAVDIPVMKSKK